MAVPVFSTVNLTRTVSPGTTTSIGAPVVGSTNILVISNSGSIISTSAVSVSTSLGSGLFGFSAKFKLAELVSVSVFSLLAISTTTAVT